MTEQKHQPIRQHAILEALRRSVGSATRPGPVTVAKCYRLLKSIFATAVADDLIVKNPCVLRGAGVEHSPERPVASIAEVDRLVGVAPPHLQALILTATSPR